MLSRYAKYLLAFILACFVTGCGYKEGVIQKDSVAYLWFTGNTEQSLVFLDGKEPFALNQTGGSEKGKPTYYQVPPGKHRVVVKKGNEVVVDRVLIVGDGIIKEILVP
jgi:hypothetical protein